MDGDLTTEEVNRLKAETKRARAPRPASCKKYAKARFAEELPQIMRTLTAEAKRGSVPHLKALLELTGLDKAEPPAAAKRKGKSLEAILREQWKKDDEDEAARIAAKEAKRAADAAESRGNEPPDPNGAAA